MICPNCSNILIPEQNDLGLPPYKCLICGWPIRKENFEMGIPDEGEPIEKICGHCEQPFKDSSKHHSRCYCLRKECIQDRWRLLKKKKYENWKKWKAR